MKIFIKKCNKCNNIIISKNDSNILCCNEEMKDIKPNSTDASFEKHVPEYTINDGKINIKVNHVMEENHYIMWIMMVCDSNIYYKEFKVGETPEVTFDYNGNGIIYSYCNLHSLWSKEIE